MVVADLTCQSDLCSWTIRKMMTEQYGDWVCLNGGSGKKNKLWRLFNKKVQPHQDPNITNHTRIIGSGGHQFAGFWETVA